MERSRTWPGEVSPTSLNTKCASDFSMTASGADSTTGEPGRVVSTHHSINDDGPGLPAASNARVNRTNRAMGLAPTKVATVPLRASRLPFAHTVCHRLLSGSLDCCEHDAADVNDCSTHCT